jgi:hypothetical protein
VLSFRPSSVEDCPLWTFDAAAMGAAEAQGVVYLKPCSLHPDPIRCAECPLGVLPRAAGPEGAAHSPCAGQFAGFCSQVRQLGGLTRSVRLPTRAGAAHTSSCCAPPSRRPAPRTRSARRSCTRTPATTGPPAIWPCAQPPPASPSLAVSNSTRSWTPRRTGPSVSPGDL